MNVKLGTQAWSKTPQPGIQHTDNVHHSSAFAEEKVTGQGENIGDVLNRVADPNYVSQTHKRRTVGNPELGKDAFMSLLLTQMKSQDPTNPMKSHEMAAQLAQFTSLEKLTNIESAINKLRTDSKPDKNFEALQLIGKTVVTDSTKITRADQKTPSDLKFSLAADAIKATVSIKDAKGNIVRTLTFNNLKKGKNDVSWNGQFEDGTQAPLGDYTLDVEARNSSGAKIFAQMKSQGTITGVNFTSHGPQVLIGKEAIDIADIKSISDNAAKEGAPAPGIPTPGFAKNAISLPASLGGTASPIPSAENIMPLPVAKHEKPTVKPETKSDGAKRSRLAQGSLTDAQMPGSLYKQLENAGAGEGEG